jgi:hypothetical protein
VEHYAELMEEDVIFPAVDVIFDGNEYIPKKGEICKEVQQTKNIPMVAWPDLKEKAKNKKRNPNYDRRTTKRS